MDPDPLSRGVAGHQQERELQEAVVRAGERTLFWIAMGALHRTSLLLRMSQ